MATSAGGTNNNGLSAEARLARRTLAQRRQRTVFFEDRIFDDCSWDMMLDALVAREEGRRNTLSDICLSTSAPTATAFRHLTKLIERDVMERHPDPRDARRAWVVLRPNVEERLRVLLQSWSLQDAAETLRPTQRCSCQRR